MYALIHAGLRPLAVDVDADFDASVDHARQLANRSDIGLAIYAPYGGYPAGLRRWHDWAKQTGIPLLIDLAQTPDPAVWRQAGRTSAVIVTSFRAGKPLGAQGGGLVAGSRELIESIRTFISGGYNQAGRKIAIGLELPLHPAAATAAHATLVAHLAHLASWRTATAEALHRLDSDLLPGWMRPEGVSLSRIPCTTASGTPLHPDATHRLQAVRDAITLRFGPTPQFELPHLDALYDRIRVYKVTPHLESAHANAGDPT